MNGSNSSLNCASSDAFLNWNGNEYRLVSGATPASSPTVNTPPWSWPSFIGRGIEHLHPARAVRCKRRDLELLGPERPCTQRQAQQQRDCENDFSRHLEFLASPERKRSGQKKMSSVCASNSRARALAMRLAST